MSNILIPQSLKQKKRNEKKTLFNSQVKSINNMICLTETILQ